MGQEGKVATGGIGDLGPKSNVFRASEIAAKVAVNGSQGRNYFKGRLVTGEAVSVHASVQPQGTVPNPEHRIQHSEILCVNSGTLRFKHEGQTDLAGPGSVVFVAVGTMHQVSNGGDGPVSYTVLAMGGDIAK
jgi:quercetin dioxygenase-like cupin family protein